VGTKDLSAKGPRVASDLNGAAVIAFVINIISATVIGGSDIGSADVAPKTLNPEHGASDTGLKRSAPMVVSGCRARGFVIPIISTIVFGGRDSDSADMAARTEKPETGTIRSGPAVGAASIF
jgi:hypothetical protein